MIFLEETVNQILNEEGQLVVSLDDLQITWEMLEQLFVGTYNQAKGYISVYDWENKVIGSTPQKVDDWTHIRHITYNAVNNMQRFLPDVPGNYWEFNPYTKNAVSLINTNFSLEVGKYPTLQNLPFSLELQGKANQPIRFLLPCNFNLGSFKLGDFKATLNTEKNIIELKSDNGIGKIDPKSLIGEVTFYTDSKETLNIISKYLGILELDLTCELFYTWFKSNVLTMIGAIKRQIDLQGVQLPFDINQDDLLARGRELAQKVEELKASKSHWSNF